MNIRCCNAYTIISVSAAGLIARIPPIVLMALERKEKIQTVCRQGLTIGTYVVTWKNEDHGRRNLFPILANGSIDSMEKLTIG